MGSSVAVIGLRHGERHVRGFLAAGAQKVYAVDINKDLFEKVSHDRVVTSDNYQAVLPLVDMVVISLPPALHQEVLKAALGTNVSRIWVEKPLLDIGQDPKAFTPDERVEIIHELRRSQAVRDWASGRDECREAWLSWRRPVPPQYNPAHYPIGVVHDLGSHLVDLSFALLKQSYMPILDKANLLSSVGSNTQEADFTLNFGNVPVHITAAWVDDSDWPDKEITARIQTLSNIVSWASQKSTHRHLTENGKLLTEDQIRQEKDWYTAALQGDPTHFTSLATAIEIQKICNDVVNLLQKDNS